MRYATFLLVLATTVCAQSAKGPQALERQGLNATATIPTLLRQARTADPEARPLLLRAASVLLRDLDEDAGRGRAGSYRELVRASRRAAPHLVALLPLATREERFHLYSSIGVLGSRGEAAVPGLVAHSIAADETELAAIARSLGKIGPRSPVAGPLLDRLLRHPSAAVRVDATYACRRMGGALLPLTPSLVELADDPRAFTRANVLVALAALDRHVAPHVGLIVDRLSDPESEVRFSAIWALDQSLVALGDRHPAVRHDDIVPHVTPLLRDAKLDVRWWAASCLSRLGPAAVDAVPPLVERLAVERGSVQESIAWALHCIGPRAETLPDLCEALENGSSYTREVVASILERYGSAAAGALPALEAMLGSGASEDETVRRLIRAIRRHLAE